MERMRTGTRAKCASCSEKGTPLRHSARGRLAGEESVDRQRRRRDGPEAAVCVDGSVERTSAQGRKGVPRPLRKRRWSSWGQGTVHVGEERWNVEYVEMEDKKVERHAKQAAAQ